MSATQLLGRAGLLARVAAQVDDLATPPVQPTDLTGRRDRLVAYLHGQLDGCLAEDHPGDRDRARRDHARLQAGVRALERATTPVATLVTARDVLNLLDRHLRR